MISPSQRPQPDNTQHSQETDIHDPGGIRTRNPSKRVAVDGRLRPRGHWDRLKEESYGPRNAAMIWLALVVRIWEVMTREPTALTNAYRGFSQFFQPDFGVLSQRRRRVLLHTL